MKRKGVTADFLEQSVCQLWMCALLCATCWQALSKFLLWDKCHWLQMYRHTSVDQTTMVPMMQPDWSLGLTIVIVVAHLCTVATSNCEILPFVISSITLLTFCVLNTKSSHYVLFQMSFIWDAFCSDNCCKKLLGFLIKWAFPPQHLHPNVYVWWCKVSFLPWS